MFSMWLAASRISKKICKSTWEMRWWKSDNQQLPMSWQFWFLKSIETRSLTLNLFSLSRITNQYIRDITAKVKTEMVKIYLTPLGRFLSSVPWGSWKNDRKMTPLPLCRGCEGQGLMGNRLFAAGHSHSPSVPCDFCSPALQRAYSLSTRHLSSLSFHGLGHEPHNASLPYAIVDDHNATYEFSLMFRSIFLGPLNSHLLINNLAWCISCSTPNNCQGKGNNPLMPTCTQ